ncbi:hypothetical protein ACG0Z6_03975 [Roseateles sp. BYS180W]|uniref:Uncharacterized protein n=1 Tax=Roseateles rivi TaxID=3299028 RepID=A0ABW7FSU2_9BURK
MKPIWRQLALYAAALVVLILVALAYMQPELMRVLADQVWRCA